MKTKATSNGMTLREKQVLGYVCLAHATNHMLDLTYAAILGVVAMEFGVSLVLLGAFATSSALALGISALPAGFLSDRIGSRRTLVLCLYGSAAAAALVAASPSVWLLGATLTLMGITGGLYHPAGISYITREIRQRAKGLGYHGVAGSVGIFLAPPLATVMVGLWSWRAAFLLVSAITVVAALVMQRGTLEGGERGHAADASAQGEGATPAASWDRRKYLFPLLAVFGVNLLAGFNYRATLTYLPLHLQENLGVTIFGLTPEVMGGMVAGVALFFGAIGQYLGGHLGERYRREVLLLPLAAVIAPALWAVGLTGGVLLIVAASTFAFFNFMAQPSYTALIADYTPSRTQGRMYGLVFALGLGVGSMGGVVGGWVAQTAGVRWVFPVAGSLALGIVAFTSYLSLAALARSRNAAKI